MFDILTFDILTLDILTLDILTFDILGSDIGMKLLTFSDNPAVLKQGLVMRYTEEEELWLNHQVPIQ
jgi:hypothetical protein